MDVARDAEGHLEGGRSELLRQVVDVDEVVARLMQLAHSAIDSGDQALAADALRAITAILELLDTDD